MIGNDPKALVNVLAPDVVSADSEKPFHLWDNPRPMTPEREDQIRRLGEALADLHLSA